MDESALHFRSKNSNGFLTQTIKAPDERYVVSTIDIDIDGDKDFLVAFFADDYSAPLDSAQGLLTEKTIFFPNPTTDQLHIKYDKNTSTHYVIYDLLGREVNHQNKMGVHHSLDVSFLAKGSYLIKAMDDEETTSLHKQPISEKEYLETGLFPRPQKGKANAFLFWGLA